MTTNSKKLGKKAEQEQTSPTNVSASKSWFIYIKRYWQLYVLLILPLVYFTVFKYIPMAYVSIAFKKYSIVQSLSEMPLAKNHGF